MQTRLFHLITVSKQYYVCNEREHWLNLEIIINYFIYLITQLDINRKIEHYGR